MPQATLACHHALLALFHHARGAARDDASAAILPCQLPNQLCRVAMEDQQVTAQCLKPCAQRFQAPEQGMLPSRAERLQAWLPGADAAEGLKGRLRHHMHDQQVRGSLLERGLPQRVVIEAQVLVQPY